MKHSAVRLVAVGAIVAHCLLWSNGCGRTVLQSGTSHAAASTGPPAGLRAGGESRSAAGAVVGDPESSERRTVPPPDGWGPYGIGARSLKFVDAKRDNRALPAIVYYPAHAKSVRTGKYWGPDAIWPTKYAVRDAAPDFGGAPYPVVLYSHGSGGQKEAYKHLLEYLASHGYVAVALDHPGNVGFLNYTPRYPDMSIKRYVDLRFVLDRMLEKFADAQSPLAQLGDPGRIGVAGHSYGGNTILGAAGVAHGWEHIAKLCGEPSPFDPFICPLIGARPLLDSALPDRRIRAAVSFAHDGAQTYFGPNCEGARSLSIPVMVVGGTADKTSPFDSEAAPCFQRMPRPAYQLQLIGGGHLGFSDFASGGTMPLSRMHELSQRYAVSFFGYHLKGEPLYRAWLGAEAASGWRGNRADFTWQSR